MNEERLTIFAKTILAINRALLGLVNPSLRAVMFNVNEDSNELTLYFYHDGPLTKNLEEHYQLISQKALQNFFLVGESLTLHTHIIRLDFPARCTLEHDRAAYIRCEPFQDPIK